MSLIIAFVGKNGCVMVSDKRRISYFGNKEDIKVLEDELYSGAIKSDEELNNRAKILNVSIKISDNESKLRILDDAIVAEVSTKSTYQAQRKRIYGTTNGYEIAELEGSEISKIEKGNSAVIVFGNKITKFLANEFLNKEFKSNVSLKYMSEIFVKILEKVSNRTPSIGKEFESFIKHPKYSNEESIKHLDDLIKMDVNLLVKFRDKLTQDLFDKSEEIKLASKIINQGEIGVINNVENNLIYVTLNSNVQAYNSSWKLIVKPGKEALMVLSDDSKVQIGDKVVIENEVLCIERNKANLKSDIILTGV